ncbi:MAG: hypothetical protein ACPGWS_00680 [Solirubrobacterales bacterium]
MINLNALIVDCERSARSSAALTASTALISPSAISLACSASPSAGCQVPESIAVVARGVEASLVNSIRPRLAHGWTTAEIADVMFNKRLGRRYAIRISRGPLLAAMQTRAGSTAD